MDKLQIANELDKLKLKIMLDEGIKSTDEYKFDEWVDEMQLRGKFTDKPWRMIGNKKYATYQTIKKCVDDLFYKKHGDRFEYHKYNPEIREIIASVVAMAMFYLEKLEDKPCS